MSESYKVHDESKAYFITFSTVKWLKVFVETKYIEIILDSIKYCQKHKSLELYAYCIMPTHIHMIARGENASLSGIIRDLKKFTSVQIVRQLEKDGDKNELLEVFRKEGLRIKRNLKYKFWQDGFHPLEITSALFFKEKINYIHNNPVNAGLVDFPINYKYSSARNYSDLLGVLDVILEY